MRTRNALVLSALLIVAAPALAQPPGNSQAEGAPNAAPRQPVFMSADKLTWTDLDPVGAPGVKVADLGAITGREHSARSSSFQRGSSPLFTRILT